MPEGRDARGLPVRVLLPLLLATAAVAVLSPPVASACHAFELEPIEGATTLGYRFRVDADYGGCPHALTLCVEAWRDGTLIVLVCPAP